LYLPHEKPREDGKYNLNKLDAEIRLRHLFQGDADTHRWAKKASDGYEHSYDPLWTVRDRAVQAAQASLGYLRSAILDYGGLDASYKAQLVGDYLIHPHTNKVHIAVQGELRGPASQLDQIEALPNIQLFHEPDQLGVDPFGDAHLVFRTGVRAEGLPEGVELQPDPPEIVALPGTVNGTELITGDSQETVAEGQARLSWQTVVRNGREVMSITDASLQNVPVRAQPRDVVSVDPLHEYRVVHVDGHAAGITQERLAAIFIRYQSELAADGWELLCLIPSALDESLTLVCRREAALPDPEE
jgi:hypothetical protein